MRAVGGGSSMDAIDPHSEEATMAPEHLHHAGEDARLDHTQNDLSFGHLIGWTELLVGLSALLLLAVVALLMIFV
jgi:hypothetical protein